MYLNTLKTFFLCFVIALVNAETGTVGMPTPPAIEPATMENEIVVITTLSPNTTVVPISTSTQPPTTSTQPPTTSTQPPTTPTQPPTTSTQPPTTSTHPPTTSTQPPTTTTTTVVPSTTSAPGPNVGMFSYFDGNRSCIIVQFAIQLNLTYHNITDKAVRVLYDIPKNPDTQVVDGYCGKDNQFIVLEWGKAKNLTSRLRIDFKLETNEFYMDNISFTININERFNDAKENQTITLDYIGHNFTTPVAMSYHCIRSEMLKLNNKLWPDVNDTMALTHVQLEAFHKEKEAQFSTAIDCDAIITPDIVPIVVGLTLAGLVLIVLIGYLIARRRSQARGYLSM